VGGGDAGCGATGCDPWWDPNFGRRRKLTFDQRQQSGSVESLTVLVLLDTTRIDYAAAQSLGQDLRFIDDDGRTVLSHEVERWTVGGTSVAWVRVPRIEPRTDLDHVWMYYGSASAPDTQQPRAVWADYDAVYHLDAFTDSAGNQAAATDHGTIVVTDGIGHARGFDGVAAYIDLGPNLSMLQAASMVTVSLRVRARSIVGERALLSASVNSTVPTGLSRAFVSFVNAADVRAGGRARDVDATSSFLTTLNAPVSVGANLWQHVAAVMDLGTQEIRLFVDGILQQTDALSVPFSAPTTDATPTSFNVLGASDDLTSQYLDGALDEVRVAPTVRTAAWVETDARSERDALIQFGPEQIL
jgi:biopolymer transport protein ExbB